MDKMLKIFSCALLLFNGLGAIYGGLNLMAYTDGSSIQLSSEWLQHTPFRNYLIPGIILFIANGMFSIFALVATVMSHPKFPLFIAVQGIILTGWIVIQILMIQTVYFLHLILGSAGIALIFLGLFQRNLKIRLTVNENQKV